MEQAHREERRAAVVRVPYISVRCLSDLLGVSYRKHLIDELVVDGHSRERLKDLVRVAPAICKHEDAAATTVKGGSAAGDPGEEEEDAVESDIPPGMYCRHCYRLELEGAYRAQRDDGVSP